MLKDLSSSKKLVWQPILASIKALQSLGIEINAESIIAEAKLSPEQLAQSPELLDFINQCQQITTSSLTDINLQAALEEAQANLLQLEKVITTLTEQNQLLIEEQQISWQNGYETALDQYRAWYEQSNIPVNSFAEEEVYPASPTIDLEQVSEEELRDLIQSRIQRHTEEADHSKKLDTAKFVGTNRQNEKQDHPVLIIRNVPPRIRKACLVLGLRPEELTIEVVQRAWKITMSTGTHPDLGGDTEIAVYLNTARDILKEWLEAQEPKLGKQFNRKGTPTSQPSNPKNL